ncbi:hypothetical protein BBW65_02755 [Helicobacter enhydrae]|uniref:Conjugal transfer protein TraF n=1 Tax=Helicobacter enhydrae TaxID=222136 RepID=A0A1B1U4S3_9HELI|nr:conjugal transfer protein TraF [Helicobacter enhydrae]ANV97787.1 hypothetical protein BBW65_02755 [Helicobacter enhydrae]
MKKLILASCMVLGSLNALGFGNMGNTSAGLGNTGVALTKSAWGVYYNPALLAADNRGKFGYSFGVNVDQQGIGALASSVLQNQADLSPESLWNSFNQHKKHSISLSSQNGLVIQITGGGYEVPKLDENGKETGEMIEKRNPYGAFTLAMFASTFLYGDIQATYNNNNANPTLSVATNPAGVALVEIPVAWGWRFETSAGDISIGTTIKYMGLNGVNANISGTISQDQQNLSKTINLPTLDQTSHWFGIDLGLLYSIYGLNVGVVAKNINAPQFDLWNQKVRVMPQFRLGLSYEFADYFALTFDTDLAPNHILFDNSPKTQMIGTGFLMDFSYIDLRFGVMGDMANSFAQGAILTGGINLLGFLDIAAQVSTEMFDIKGYKVPNFVTLKVGGSFTF